MNKAYHVAQAKAFFEAHKDDPDLATMRQYEGVLTAQRGEMRGSKFAFLRCGDAPCTIANAHKH